MQWASVSDFLSMGGYGLYVWGSYLVTLAAILIELHLLKCNRGETLKRLKRMRNFENES